MPDRVVRVTRAQVAAAKLKIALDQKRGRHTRPEIAAIANAKRGNDDD